jgi:hypothetical protein
MWAGVTLKLKIEAFEPVGLGVPDGLNATALENSFGKTALGAAESHRKTVADIH